MAWCGGRRGGGSEASDGRQLRRSDAPPREGLRVSPPSGGRVPRSREVVGCVYRYFVLATSYSPADAVPSPLEGLTSVFEMRTGVTPPVSSPEQNNDISETRAVR